MKEKIENLYAECEEKIYIEKFSDIEFRHDLKNALVHLPERQQKIIACVLEGYSDAQIAEIMGISRQYVNRIRKQVSKNVFLFQKGNGV